MHVAEKLSKLSVILVLIAPLIVYSGVQFPYTIPRWTWLLATVSIFFVASLAAKSESKTLSIRKIDIAYGVLILLMCLSLFITTDIRQSIWSGVGRTTGLALYLVCFLWFIGLRSHNYETAEWKKYFLISLGVAAIAAAWGLLDMFVFGNAGMAAGQGRLSVPAGNALILATYLTLHLFIAAFLIAERNAFKLFRMHQIFICASALIIAAATALTFSRSSYVGIALGAAVGIIGYGLMIRKTIGFRRSLQRIVSVVVVLFLGIGLFYTYATITKSGGERLKITEGSLGTLKTRFINWKIAFRSIAEHPIVGVGWENYRTAVDKLFDPSLSNFSYYETRIDKPHNVILEVWVTLGTVGLLAYLFLIYSTIRAAWCLYKRKKISLAGFWAIIGFVVAYQAQNLFAFDTPQTIFIQAFVLAYLASHDEAYQSISAKLFSKSRTVTLVLSAGILIGVFVYGGWASMRSMWYVNQGLIASQQRDFNRIDYSMRQAFIGVQGPYYFETWRWFAESLLKSYASGTQKLSDLSPEQRARWEEDVLQIAALTEKYGKENPDSFEWQTFAGKVSYFLALAKNDSTYLNNAKNYFLHAYDISHVRQEPPVLLSYVFALQGDNKQAIQWYVTSVALSPTAETATALDWLVNRFVVEKDSVSAISVLENSVTYSSNAQDYARLAAAYASVQRFDDARIAVQKAVVLDSTFADEAQKFISGFPKK